MSLLTKEQQEEVARIKGLSYDERSVVGRLLSIIDDLQARAPKQYTEQELRNVASKGSFSLNENPSEIEQEYFEIHFDAWLECARFLGALKAEP